MSKPTLHSRSLSIFISIEGIGLSFLVFTVFCLTSCTHSKDSAVSDQQTQAALHAETERAFELEARADVVIDYEWSDHIKIRTGRPRTEISATDATLASAVSGATTKRDLAVVILGKVARFNLPDEPQMQAKVDQIEAALIDQGFKQVVFQLASAFGRPIYRE